MSDGSMEKLIMMKQIKFDHFYDLEYLVKITNERLENTRLHLGSIVKRIDELGGYIDDEDRRFLDPLQRGD